MGRAIDSGGETHVKYQHFHYPREIDVKCKFCEAKAKLINKDVPNEIDHFIDVSNFRKVWELLCKGCMKRIEYNWEETKDFPLLYVIKFKRDNIWAWNKKHLEYIISVLLNNEDKLSKWLYFRNYINKSWLLNSKSSSSKSKLEKVLVQMKITDED